MTEVGVQNRPAGVAATAADVLRSEEVRFVPALAGESVSGWTLRDALVSALGCDRRAGPLAYWEWESLYSSLERTRTAIANRLDLSPKVDAERWANQGARTLEEVLRALDAVSEDEDLPVPAVPTRRAWCDPKVVTRCRVPFVPLAAVTHAWGAMDRPWFEVADELGLTAELTSWELLRKIDPVIRDAPAQAPVADVAWDLRRWKGLDERSDALASAKWLFTVTSSDPSVTLHDLRARAHEAIRRQRRPDSCTMSGRGDWLG